MSFFVRFKLHALHRRDLFSLAMQKRKCPGLEIDRAASSNLAFARFSLAEGARLKIAAGVVTERLPGMLHFLLGPGAEVEIGERTWLRTEVGPVYIVAFAGAKIRIGAGCLLNSAYVSAKQKIEIGTHSLVGMGSRIFDSDQHDFDAAHPETSAPVQIGNHAWIASDVSVLKGVSVGDHSVIGTRSVVLRSIPAHSMACGIPATPRGEVGDRTYTR